MVASGSQQKVLGIVRRLNTIFSFYFQTNGHLQSTTEFFIPTAADIQLYKMTQFPWRISPYFAISSMQFLKKQFCNEVIGAVLGVITDADTKGHHNLSAQY
mmetsp:Transcript_4543/g.6371  ORF Transcript_4543/g.6371 Transcript_4543/m.6371 type:complete len:101 (+) Transcript_4543:216-518(+)